MTFSEPVVSDHPDSSVARLTHAIEQAAHLLPAQGPITVFIHHNTLHAFEDQPFEQAVLTGARIFGCEPYLSEESYRAALERGRIRFDDLRSLLQEELVDAPEAASLPHATTRLDLRLAMMQFPIRGGAVGELNWFLEETDARRRIRPDVSAATRSRIIAETRRWVMRDLRGGNEALPGGQGPRRPRPAWVKPLFDRFREAAIENWSPTVWEAFAVGALWHVCREGIEAMPAPPPTRHEPIRHRDLLLSSTGVDTDGWVNPLLIRFCAAVLDQGVAQAVLPDREQGLFAAFVGLYGQPGGPPDAWQRHLPGELRRWRRVGITPLQAIRESLDHLGLREEEYETFLGATLLALPGWAGMVHQLEERGHRAARPVPGQPLVEFLAIRLLLDRLALAHAARQELGFTGDLATLRGLLRKRWTPPPAPTLVQRVFPVFQLAQVLGWSPDELTRLTPEQWRTLLREVEGFTTLERRRIFHLAYERRFRDQSLDALAAVRVVEIPRPRFQVVCCIDDREESFRRHLEEIAPDVETFGAAGFFNVAMYYRGAADARFVPLCPVAIVPQEYVAEEVDPSQQEEHQRRIRTRVAVGRASHHFHQGTRGFFLGALLMATLGLLATIPLVARVLFPRFTARLRKRFGRFVQTPPKTRLHLNRQAAAPGPTSDGLGFSLAERIDIGERLLRDISLTTGFARLVVLLGHGSSSLNNPHKSAYDCGACGGSAGAPNARAIAAILNDPLVRAELTRRGIAVPAETHFLGALHNTCNDSVTWADIDQVPPTHREEFERIVQEIEATCDRNAHERCRRFLSAPPELSFEAAREHVEARSEDLSQTRPELGHATNALCHVGRRSRTRGLFLDRRAFLVSYDAARDTPDAAILIRLMGAVFPVCGGINLEYYFSHVDPVGWGCNSKLPHNITSMLGVMDGAASDLRTGLPWQMVEIHEPVRLLLIVEATPETLLHVLDALPAGGQLVRNGWVQLVSQHPETGQFQIFQKGEFRPYQPGSDRLGVVQSSVDWYRGWRDHLEFARIEPVTTEEASHG